MRRNDFDESIKRVLVFYKTPGTQAEAAELMHYTQALYESTRDLDGRIFDQACCRLAKGLPLRRPDPKHFLAHYKAIVAEEARRNQSSGIPEMTPDENAQWCVQKARSLTPRAARFAIQGAEQTGLKLPEDVMQILLEKTVEVQEEETEAP